MLKTSSQCGCPAKRHTRLIKGARCHLVLTQARTHTRACVCVCWRVCWRLQIRLISLKLVLTSARQAGTLWLAGGVRSIDDRVPSRSSPNGGWLDEGDVVRCGGTNAASPAPQWKGAWMCACVFSQLYSSEAVHSTLDLHCTVNFLF